MKPVIHFIGGPTASGKTAKALELAAQKPSLIINADSMQIYKGLPLLTAQPAVEEKAAHPHRLFEVLDTAEKCSVGRWRVLAEEALKEADRHALVPIMVGGTGLYFRSLDRGLADIPDVPLEVRGAAQALYEEIGHDAFRAKLAENDPLGARKIEKNDRQRLLRAYEVVTYTGQALSTWQKQSEVEKIADRYTIMRHLIMHDRDELYARCDARFLKMIEQGALDEVRRLMARNLDLSLPAMKIVGVRELAAHLRGDRGLDEAIAKAQQLTRNYAKRQMTWFRNQWDGETNGL